MRLEEPTISDQEILAALDGWRPKIYPNLGMNEPSMREWTRPAGVYEIPVVTASGHRICYSVLETGVQVDWCLIAPGGDWYGARRFLRDRLLQVLESPLSKPHRHLQLVR